MIYLILKLITCIPVPAWRDQSAHCHQWPVVPTPTPPSVASQITGLKINFHLSLCQPQYNKTRFMKRSVLIWPGHLSPKLAFADFRSFLANIISTSLIPLLLNSNWSSVEVLLYDFFTDSLQFPLRCQILCCCVQTVCRRGVQCSDSTQSCKNTRAQILHFTFSIVWLQSVMVTSLPQWYCYCISISIYFIQKLGSYLKWHLLENKSGKNGRGINVSASNNLK